MSKTTQPPPWDDSPADTDDTDSLRLTARNLYWQGYKAAEIARKLTIPYSTVATWKTREKWADAPMATRLAAVTGHRLLLLIAKPDKTDRDYREIDELTRVMERTARIEHYGQTGKDSDLNPNIKRRNEGRRRKREEQDKTKNQLTDEQIGQLIEDFENNLFAYQQTWLDAKRHRIRTILKSRQIGATWYFAREAFVDALKTGDNQIFLSASKAQALVFRAYIVQWVRDVTGVELKGTPITLPNGAELYFLGTNIRTAQSYHGHVYLDEFAWIGRFAEFRKVASGMATHSKWRQTYFSTPSVIGHESYAFWSGEHYNKGRPRDQHITLDVSHAALRDGRVCEDGQWRQIVTIYDALGGGCSLFDIDQLRKEYNDQDFANLFSCEWVDDTASFFTFAELQAGMVDPDTDWPDIDRYAAAPYGGPVWIGYDPALSQDSAAVVVVAPPHGDCKKYRLLEKLSFRGVDFAAQAAAILTLTQRYRVEHIGMDCSTIGAGVLEIVRGFFPQVVGRAYSVEIKTGLVLKAKQILGKGLFEYDAAATDVVTAFLQIRKGATASGRQATFSAGRSKEAGHADVAWAIMHAFDRLTFNDFADGATSQKRVSFMEIHG